jgi:GTA TIM-barrel-like domain/Putative phage tail protein
MATLVLQTAGSVVGNLIGGPIGSALGNAIGQAVGSAIDQSLPSLFSGSARSSGGRRVSSGPRLKLLDGITAEEGAPIPRLYGRQRLGGQVIWATQFEEQSIVTRTGRSGGKGGFGGSSSGRSVSVNYRYFANVAIALCEGEIAQVRRVWADGVELDTTTLAMRVHTGTDDQMPDALILAREQGGQAPAYRGIAYVVFERMPLADFGNRLPQFTFEVIRPVHGLLPYIEAVCLIPGSGEHVYETRILSRPGSGGETIPNRHQLFSETDWSGSLDTLQALCPNLKHVALVVSWFGDDLRAGVCQIKPRIEPAAQDAAAASWAVSGLTRSTASAVSLYEGQAAFGGTPSDHSVILAIRDLKARGLSVTLYPFVMMDIAPGNSLLHPETGATGQPAYPWRGRITCSGAQATATVQTQVASFFGQVQASQLVTSASSVAFSGTSDWGFRRFLLHMAGLALAADGVDALVLGSEMIGLSHCLGANGAFPFVDALVTLAQDIRALVGPAVKLTYGADWTEYGARVRSNGADVRFPLDPLWASPAIDAVGIDWYPPVTDWRDGLTHLDSNLYDGPHDHTMFAAGATGGEAFDWYYASASDRSAQVRTPITDGAYGKPWIYRAKDARTWWLSQHRPRIGGIEQAPTAWVPSLKPVWILELGCPAVDRGANGPNVFPDPKSSENAVPYASHGVRDDCVQQRHLTAMRAALAEWVDPARIYLWAYDARPFPAFPRETAIWADGEAHETGHWLNGRLEGGAADDILRQILDDYGLPAETPVAVDGFLDGYVIDSPMSARDAIEPLARLFSFDGTVRTGTIRFQRRQLRPSLTIDPAGLVVDADQTALRRRRADIDETPESVTLAFVDPDLDYRISAVRSAKHPRAGKGSIAVDAPFAMSAAIARSRANILLAEAITARDTISLVLPPEAAGLECGDLIRLDNANYEIRTLEDKAGRGVIAVRRDPLVYLQVAESGARRTSEAPLLLAGRPNHVLIDVPVAQGVDTPLQALAATSTPWPGSLVLWRSRDGSSFDIATGLPSAATMGRLTAPLGSGPLWRTDTRSRLKVKLETGALQSLDVLPFFAAGSPLAVQTVSGSWEFLLFKDAVLVGPDEWECSTLIRGLTGSEAQVGSSKPAGSRVVLLDEAVIPLSSGAEDIGRTIAYRLGNAGLDHGHPLVVQFEAQPTVQALLPLSPVHAQARMNASSLRIQWIRRTRYGGDSWDLHEVPLNEDREVYALSILSLGGTILRKIETTQPSFDYALSDAIADFGSVPAILPIRVQQLSTTVGPGHALEVNMQVA